MPLRRRIMPEVPSNMQEELAHLELEAREVSKHQTSNRTESMSSLSSLTPYGDQKPSSSFPDQREQAILAQQAPQGYTADYQHTNASAYQSAYINGNQLSQAKKYEPKALPPKPSVFPKLRDAGSNVPPSDEEKEEVLERARPLVLNSNDPEMQLAWAQDALLWVDIAEGSRMRIGANQSLRSQTPAVEHQLRVDAVNIINFLAEQLHPKALFLKGIWYEFAKFGYPADKRESFKLYRLAAEKGYARAEYRIGTHYEGMQDMARAIKHYTRGVSMLDSASSYRIGMMTLLGQNGHQQDYQKAIELIKYAATTADENAPQGAYVYGMLLSRELPNITIPDLFLPVDIDHSKQFIEKAAYLGFSKAQQKMGEAYELCLLSCEFNPALSLHYNALAARQGDPAADMAISKWFLCGYEGIFAKNEELAFTYAQRSAIGGLPTAEFALGYFYEIGMFVSKDIEAAKAWYNKAKDHGNKDAIARLQGISQQKVLNKHDHEQTALNRIRSQYGSRKGARPDRFKEKASAMPAMSEERVDMPNQTIQPRRLSGVRPQSVAPYPDDRPKSVAPYPEDDVGPGSRHQSSSLRPHSGPIADRPSSAFGIRPLNLAHDASQQGLAQMRPSSSVGNMSVPHNGFSQGRGYDLASKNRVMSSSSEPQQMGYGNQPQGPGPQPMEGQLGQMPPYNNAPRGKLQKQAPSQYQQPQYSIPHSQSQPTIPHLQQEQYRPKTNTPTQQPYGGIPSNPAANLPGRSTPSGGYDTRSTLQSRGGPPQERSSSTRPDPRAPQPQRPDSQSSQQHRLGTHHSESTQSLPSRMSSATPGASSISSGVSATSGASTPTPKPAKAGPATFEEMGIPVQKPDGECVSLLLSIHCAAL